MPVTEGMVRLFIHHDDKTNPLTLLFKEVPVSTTPLADVVPVPTPKYTMYEIVFTGSLKLLAGDKLYASTQNEEDFIVIAEGVDWSYPATLPSDCCNFEQRVAATGVGIVSEANPDLDGSGRIVNLFTASSSAKGAIINTITIKALGCVHEGTIRLFLSNDDSDWFLIREISIPQTVQSGFDPSFKAVLPMEFYLQAGYSIGAATENAESFAITVEALDWLYPGIVFSRTITIDHTQCGSSDSSSFPVLVSISDATLKTTANGGHVANTNGFDILFFADSGLTTLLNWEVEFYDGVAGTLIAWVNIPTVSSSADTVFYMQYGNTSVTTFRGGAVGSVWDTDYITVWHLADGTTLNTNDSTSNGVTGTINGSPTPVAGQIDGGLHFADKTQFLVGANTQNAPHTTVSLWVNVAAIVNGGSFTTFNQPPGTHDHLLSLDGTTGNPLFYIFSGGAVIVVSPASLSTGVWHYLVGTADGTNVKLYVDGTLMGTLAGGDAFSGYTDPSIYLGGDDGTGSTPSIDFDADELRYSKTARTADWILTEYNNQNNPGNISDPQFLTYGPET